MTFDLKTVEFRLFMETILYILYIVILVSVPYRLHIFFN